MRSLYAFMFLSILISVVLSMTKPADAFELEAQSQLLGKIDQGKLAMGFVAKELCSCLWISGLDEKECREYIMLEGLESQNPSIKVDQKNKRVSASIGWFIKRESQFRNSQVGCTLTR